MNPSKIIEEIQELKIQGAENIAKKGVLALYYYILSENDIEKIKNFILKLVHARITEPTLRNAIQKLLDKTGLDDYLEHVFKNLEKDKIKYKDSIKIDLKRIKLNYKYINDHFEIVDSNISKNVIDFFSKHYQHKNTIKIYTHCHSNTVALSIINIKKKLKNKKIIVYNTETRPLFQGRITAMQLMQNGIEVHHYIDSAMMICIKECDIVLLGCDAIETNNNVINKIGSGAISYLAKEFNKPLAIITDSWKKDPLTKNKNEIIETRNIKEILDKKFVTDLKKRNLYISFESTNVIVGQNNINDTKKGQLVINNYAFEKIPYENIFVIITDSYIKYNREI